MPLGLPQLGDALTERLLGGGRTGRCALLLSCRPANRIETNNRKGLKDALQGILAADLNGTTRASIGQVIQAGDAATGTDVLKELYEEMRETLWMWTSKLSGARWVSRHKIAGLASMIKRLKRGSGSLSLAPQKVEAHP